MPRKNVTKKAPAERDPAELAAVRVCVIHGPQEMLKKQRLDELRAALEKAHGEVETFVFDGESVPLATVFDELRSYALMVRHKLVVVDRSDTFAKNFREPLERYAAAPVDHATLMLRSEKWHPGNLDKLIAKVGFVDKFEDLSPAETQAWLVRRARDRHGRTLVPAAAALLAERVGGDLMMLDTELAKLAVLVDDRGKIETGLVEQVVGRSSEAEAWAIQEAVLDAMIKGDAGQAIARLRELVELSRQPEIVVSYFVSDLMRKLHLGAMLKKQGASDFDITKALALWGPRGGMVGTILRRHDPATIGRLFDRMIELDARGKSGFGEPMRNLEMFCAELKQALQPSNS